MVSVRKQKLGREGRELLHEVGLSADAISLYELLLMYGELSTQEAASNMGTFASALYRLFYVLVTHGLVIEVGGRPKRFRALAVRTGLAAARQAQVAKLDALLAAKQGKPAKQAGDLELLVGKKALYDRYEVLAGQAQHTIRAYTIGIAYSASLWQTQANAVARGVHIEHVVQEVHRTNYHIIDKWRRLGIRVRHDPAPRGFHLMIFDDRHVLVSFSNPLHTDDRLSIDTDNPTAAQLFVAQFAGIWKQAQRVE